jgi:hypothetical protein
MYEYHCYCKTGDQKLEVATGAIDLYDHISISIGFYSISDSFLRKKRAFILENSL